MPSTLPSSIPDSQLGLSAAELHILRQHQQIALSSSASSGPAPHYSHSTTSSRGRGHARSSASTSRAASAASSAGGGNRLLLDAGSLAVLGSHFERLMMAIQNRVDSVCRLFFSAQNRHSLALHDFPSDFLCLRLLVYLAIDKSTDRSPAHSPDPTLHLPPILPRRLLHRPSRRRNRTLPRDYTADRRAGGRIRQGAAYTRHRQRFPCSCRRLREASGRQGKRRRKGQEVTPKLVGVAVAELLREGLLSYCSSRVCENKFLV